MGVYLLKPNINNSYDIVKVAKTVDVSQPQLYTPTISFSDTGTLLTITDTDNGDFASYDIYTSESELSGYSFLTNVSSTEINISNYITNEGILYIKVKAIGNNFKDSDFSNTVTWVAGAGTEGLEYTLLTGGQSYACSGIGTATETDIEIGSVYNGLPVTVISGGFKNNTTITKVVIPASITTITGSAFSGCTAITEVEIKSGCTAAIGQRVFAYCTALRTVKLPATITSVSAAAGTIAAFDGCSLQYIYVETWAQYYGYGSYVRPAYNMPNKLYINNTLVTSITVPAGITTIPQYKFTGLEDVTTIDISSDDVTSIGTYAFYGCNHATEITIGKNVATIETYAFTWCSKLTTITFIGSTTTNMSLKGRAFSNCKALTSINLPNIYELYGGVFDGCNNLLTVDLGERISGLNSDYNAFGYCLGGSAVTTLYVRATNPPNMRGSSLGKTPNNVYVPSSSVSTYQSATNWANYSSKISAII